MSRRLARFESILQGDTTAVQHLMHNVDDDGGGANIH